MSCCGCGQERMTGCRGFVAVVSWRSKRELFSGLDVCPSHQLPFSRMRRLRHCNGNFVRHDCRGVNKKSLIDYLNITKLHMKQK